MILLLLLAVSPSLCTASTEYTCKCNEAGVVNPRCLLSTSDPQTEHSVGGKCPFSPSDNFNFPWTLDDPQTISIPVPNTNQRWLCTFPPSCLSTVTQRQGYVSKLAEVWKLDSSSFSIDTSLPTLSTVLGGTFGSSDVNINNPSVEVSFLQGGFPTATVTLKGAISILGTTGTAEITVNGLDSNCENPSVQLQVTVDDIDAILQRLLSKVMSNLPAPTELLKTFDVPASKLLLLVDACFPNQVTIRTKSTVDLFGSQLSTETGIKTSFSVKIPPTSPTDTHPHPPIISLTDTSAYLLVSLPSDFTLSMLNSGLSKLDTIKLSSGSVIITNSNNPITTVAGVQYTVSPGLTIQAVLGLVNADQVLATVGHILKVSELTVTAHVGSMTEFDLTAAASDFSLRVTEDITILTPALFVSYSAPIVRVGFMTNLQVVLSDRPQDTLLFQGKLFVESTGGTIGLGMTASMLNDWVHPLGLTYGDVTIVKPSVTSAFSVVGSSVVLSALEVDGTMKVAGLEVGGAVHYQLGKAPVLIGVINNMNLGEFTQKFVSSFDNTVVVPHQLITVLDTITWSEGSLGLNPTFQAVTFNNRDYGQGAMAYLTNLKVDLHKLQLSGDAQLQIDIGLSQPADKGFTLHGNVDPFSIGPFDFGGIADSSGHCDDTTKASLLVKLRTLSGRAVGVNTCIKLFSHQYGTKVAFSDDNMLALEASVAVKIPPLVDFTFNAGTHISLSDATFTVEGIFNADMINALATAVPQEINRRLQTKQDELEAAQRELTNEENKSEALKKALDAKIDAITGPAHSSLAAAEKKVQEKQAELSAEDTDLTELELEKAKCSGWSKYACKAKVNIQIGALNLQIAATKAALKAAEVLLATAKQGIEALADKVKESHSVIDAEAAYKAAFTVTEANRLVVVGLQHSLKPILFVGEQMNKFQGKVLQIDTVKAAGQITTSTSSAAQFTLPGKIEGHFLGQPIAKDFTITEFEVAEVAARIADVLV